MILKITTSNDMLSQCLVLVSEPLRVGMYRIPPPKDPNR